MGNEVKRQAFTQLLVFGPMQYCNASGRLLYLEPFTNRATSLRDWFCSVAGSSVVQCLVVRPN